MCECGDVKRNLEEAGLYSLARLGMAVAMKKKEGKREEKEILFDSLTVGLAGYVYDVFLSGYGGQGLSKKNMKLIYDFVILQIVEYMFKFGGKKKLMSKGMVEDIIAVAFAVYGGQMAGKVGKNMNWKY